MCSTSKKKGRGIVGKRGPTATPGRLERDIHSEAVAVHLGHTKLFEQVQQLTVGVVELGRMGGVREGSVVGGHCENRVLISLPLYDKEVFIKRTIKTIGHVHGPVLRMLMF